MLLAKSCMNQAFNIIAPVDKFAAQLSKSLYPEADSEHIIVVAAAGSVVAYNCSGFGENHQRICTPVNTEEGMWERKPSSYVNLKVSDNITQGKLYCFVHRAVYSWVVVHLQLLSRLSYPTEHAQKVIQNTS